MRGCVATMNRYSINGCAAVIRGVCCYDERGGGGGGGGLWYVVLPVMGTS